MIYWWQGMTEEPILCRFEHAPSHIDPTGATVNSALGAVFYNDAMAATC